MQEHDTFFLLFPFLPLFMLCYACFSSFGIGHLLLLRRRHLSHGSQNKPVSPSFLNIALPLSLLQCSKLFSFGEKEGSIFSAIHPHTGKVRERVYLRRRVRDTKKAVQTHTYPLTAVSRTFDSIFLSLLCFLFFWCTHIALFAVVYPYRVSHTHTADYRVVGDIRSLHLLSPFSLYLFPPNPFRCCYSSPSHQCESHPFSSRGCLLFIRYEDCLSFFFGGGKSSFCLPWCSPPLLSLLPPPSIR